MWDACPPCPCCLQVPWLSWAEQLQDKHTQAQTNSTHTTTNNGIQRREKTRREKNGSLTGDTVEQEDPQGHDGPEQGSSTAAPEKQSQSGPLQEVTLKTEMIDMQEDRLQDLRT